MPISLLVFVGSALLFGGLLGLLPGPWWMLGGPVGAAVAWRMCDFFEID